MVGHIPPPARRIELAASVGHQPGAQILEVFYHDLLRLGAGSQVTRVDVEALQHVFHQGLAARHHQLPMMHAEVDFDDGLLCRVQSPVGLEDDLHLGIPFFVQRPRVGRLVEQVRLPAQAAEDEVAILAVLSQ